MSDDTFSGSRNPESRRVRRRRRRNGEPEGAAATPAPEAGAHWVDRVDALAGKLASLRTRGAILDQVVREVMRLLPAEAVVVHADEALAAAEPGRTVLPLATAGRRFGAVEITMRADRAVDPAERALGAALVRQAALALERVALEDAAWPPAPETGGITPPPVADATAIERALDRLATDVRRLAGLARSTALPPAGRIEEAERTAAATIADLRARLLTAPPAGEA
jgi:hypothetical protein